MSKTVQPYQKELGLAQLQSDQKAQGRSPRGNTSGSGFPAGYAVLGQASTPPAGFTSGGADMRVYALDGASIVQARLYVWTKT